MAEVKIKGAELRSILGEYAYDDDVFNNETKKVRLAKRALGMLPDADRIIFCLVLDKASSREVGKILGCSHSTILKQFARIRQQVLKNITEIENDEDDDL